MFIDAGGGLLFWSKLCYSFLVAVENEESSVNAREIF